MFLTIVLLVTIITKTKFRSTLSRMNFYEKILDKCRKQFFSARQPKKT